MIRSTLAATLAAALGAAIGPAAREAARDALLTYPDLWGVGMTGLCAGLAWSLIMQCFEAPSPHCPCSPPRDAAGRFRKR